MSFMDTKQILTEFIECYRNNPVLWDSGSETYQQSDKKYEALKELQEVLRQFNAEATIISVKKKINTLRSGYRRERKKLKTAADRGHAYKPVIWWYELMEFLEPVMVRNEQHDQSTNDSFGTFSMHEEVLVPVKLTAKREPSISPSNKIPFKKQKPKNYGDDSNEFHVHNDAVNYEIKETHKSYNNDWRAENGTGYNLEHFNHMTKTWANKLNKLARSQYLYAEKAINDILFEAEMGTLSRNSVQITISQPEADTRIVPNESENEYESE